MKDELTTEDILEILEKIDNIPEDEIVHIKAVKDMSRMEKAKWQECKKIVQYINKHDIGIETLAKQLNEVEVKLKPMIYYKYDKFTLLQVRRVVDKLPKEKV